MILTGKTSTRKTACITNGKYGNSINIINSAIRFSMILMKMNPESRKRRLSECDQESSQSLSKRFNSLQLNRNYSPIERISSEKDIYSPVMDVQSNPHYYDANKLLFYLHIERVRRNPNNQM